MPFHSPSERENCSAMVFLHSSISNPISRESICMVAVFAVPAGPVSTRMRYCEKDIKDAATLEVAWTYSILS